MPGPKLHKSIQTYSAVAGAFLGIASTANAAIQYTDINPDLTFNTNNTGYDLDLNNDTIIDFRLEVFTAFTDKVVISPEGSNSVFSYMTTGYQFAKKMNLYSLVHSGLNWNNFYFNPTPFLVLAQSFNVLNLLGEWHGANDKYLGLKLKVGGQVYYGWARLDVSAGGGSFTIKDYAYEDIPNASIPAGKMGSVAADPVVSVIAQDIADNGNGADMRVTFNKVLDENKVDEYQIIVLKSQDTATFDLSSANAVTLANYTPVSPTGNNIAEVLASASADKDGDPVRNGVSYNVYVLTVADGTLANINALSLPSGAITLHTITEEVSNLGVSDVDDYGDGRDLKVSFDKILNESKADHYRVMVVKSSKSASFSLAAAEGLGTGLYVKVNKTGSNIVQALGATSRDTDGDFIVENLPYKVFVLTIADGVNATLNALSSPSSEVTLTSATGVGLQSGGDHVKIYAVNKQIHIQTASLNAQGRVSVFNIAGKLVSHQTFTSSKSMISMKLLPVGYYMVQVEREEGIAAKKVYIE